MKGYIYHITNKINGKCYIGQTIHYDIRKATHLRDLRNSCHHSKKEKQEYLTLSQEQMEVLKLRYKAGTLND